jgi:hypothetical protein
MTKAGTKPIDGTFRSWSDGHRVHLLVRFTGGTLGRGPVTMHATTELVPAREAVIGHYRERAPNIAGDPVQVEALATRVGVFSALRRIGRAAKGAAAFATAPARALGSAGVNTWRTTTNLAKGLEGATALTAYATKPLAWRPGSKRSPAGQGEPEPNSESAEENPMTDETSGSPRPQTRHVRSAHNLLRRAQTEPAAARHVSNIAKAAAKGHPGAKVAQAAIKEARKEQRRPLMPPKRWIAFSAWAKGAA